MSRLYALLFCFENEIRDFIRERLADNEGVDWQDKLPDKTKKFVEGRRDTALKDTWLEGQKTDILGFADFGQLSQIIIAKWDFFKDVIPLSTGFRNEWTKSKRHATSSLIIACYFQANSIDFICILPTGTG